MTIASTSCRLAALGIGLFLWSPLSFGDFLYRADAIEGWVVDVESNKPLEGVIVIAHWQLQSGEGGTPVNELEILETVTDHNGRYFFPAWGPKFAPSGRLWSESPEILMFKRGYKFQRLMNQWYQDMDTSKSRWNKKTIKLEPYSGTLAQYAEDLASLSSSLWVVGVDVGRHSGNYCGWKSFPRMLRALDRLEAEFRAAKVDHGTIASDLKANSRKLASQSCGSVSEILDGEER